MRRAYGSQTIEIATRLTDVTCVTEPRELQGTPRLGSARFSLHPFRVYFVGRMRALGVAESRPAGSAAQLVRYGYR